MKKSSLIRITGYIFVIGFGLVGVMLKDSIGDYGMYVIFAGLPLGIFCILYAVKVQRREERRNDV